ncbi:MAG: 4Fe-4S binding protein [Thermoplasmata archaeon]|nr:4Fe-4S binding protein [Thermoplasmata archaeon]
MKLKVRLLRIKYLRLSVQFVLVILLNLTLIGSYWLSPVLPILRLDIPTDIAAGGQKTCTLGTALRSLTLFWPFMLLIITIAILILICIIIGRALCAWACPIGLFHDLVTKGRQTVRVNPKEFSLKTHNKLVGAKYAVLFLILLVALSMGLSQLSGDTVSNLYISNFPEGTTQTAPYCQYCPTPVLYYISNSLFLGAELGLTTPVNAAMLFIFIGLVIGAVAMPRFWCRYLCPMGALSSFFNKVSIFSIRKNQSKCNRCNYCVDSCPTRVQIIRDEDKDERVTDMNCDFCLECIEACPEKALSLSVGKKAIYRGGKKQWWQRPPLKPT